MNTQFPPATLFRPPIFKHIATASVAAYTKQLQRGYFEPKGPLSRHFLYPKACVLKDYSAPVDTNVCEGNELSRQRTPCCLFINLCLILSATLKTNHSWLQMFDILQPPRYHCAYDPTSSETGYIPISHDNNKGNLLVHVIYSSADLHCWQCRSAEE